MSNEQKETTNFCIICCQCGDRRLPYRIILHPILLLSAVAPKNEKLSNGEFLLLGAAKQNLYANCMNRDLIGSQTHRVRLSLSYTS